MKIRNYLLTIFLLFTTIFNLSGQGDGLLIKDGRRLFPIGWYYMPKDDISLSEMVEAGFNLFNCRSFIVNYLIKVFLVKYGKS